MNIIGTVFIIATSLLLVPACDREPDRTTLKLIQPDYYEVTESTSLGVHSSQEIAETEVFLANECQMGKRMACRKAAELAARSGKSQLAVASAKTACFKHDRAACELLAKLATSNNMDDLLEEALEELCRYKHEPSCRTLYTLDKNRALMSDSSSAPTCDYTSPHLCYEKGQEAQRTGNLAFAKRLFEQGCYYENGESCRARLSLPMSAADRQYYLHRACILGIAQGCTGMLREELSTASRQSYEDLACAYGDSAICVQQGSDLLTQKQTIPALTRYSQACLLRNTTGCQNLVTELATENNHKSFAAGVCDKIGATRCFELGHILWERHDFGNELINIACSLGESLACMHSSMQSTEAIVEKTCAQGQPQECDETIQIMIEGQNINAAGEIAEHSCQNGSKVACDLLAEQKEQQGDLHEAFELLAKTCEQGSEGSCVKSMQLAQHLALTPPNEAIDHIQQNCRQGHGKSCYALAQRAKKEGRTDEAETFFKAACQHGYGIICEEDLGH